MDVVDPVSVVRFAVAVDLPGAPPVDEQTDRTLTTAALNVVTAMRVEGLVHRALEIGRVHASPLTTADVQQAWIDAQRRSLTAEWWATETIRVLAAAELPTRVLKGIAVAHLDHADPSERVFGDADVLIRRGDLRRALVALTAAGFSRIEPPVRGWWERRFSKAIMLRTPSGGELDLHLAITGGFFGERIDHDRLWSAPAESFDLDGLTAHALDLQGRWLHACCHAVLGGGSGLRATRDVAQLLLLCEVDWRQVVRDATDDGVDAVVAQAVRDTWELLRLDPAHPAAQWAAHHEAPPDQRRALAASLMANETGWGPEGWSTLQALSLFARARFLTGIAWPSRANLRHRGRTRRRHLRIMATTLRAVVRRRDAGE